ncbi:MAG: PIG-L family deacetylase [Acidobacteriota bacterium]
MLAVVAHPDDEYHFAVTLYRIVRELGGVADQVVITDGAGGHRYSSFAEKIYGLPLSGQHEPRTSLRDIRRAETAVAGHVIGIRQHFFLDQPDSGFTLNQGNAIGEWNHFAVTEALDSLLTSSNYDFVFLLLPSDGTHGHHKAAALLTLEAVERLPLHQRPIVLAAEAGTEAHAAHYRQLDGHPATRVSDETFAVSRKQQHPSDEALNYQIIANWVIAAHKSQGLFQMDAGRHDVERFWRLEIGASDAARRTEHLFQQLRGSLAHPIGIPA